MRPDPKYLAKVRAIIARELKGQPVDVFVFGSWARGDAMRISDIDIAVLPRGDIPPLLISNLREVLEESTIPYPIDLVDLRDTSEAFRARVLREGIPWTV